MYTIDIFCEQRLGLYFTTLYLTYLYLEACETRYLQGFQNLKAEKMSKDKEKSGKKSEISSKESENMSNWDGKSE